MCKKTVGYIIFSLLLVSFFTVQGCKNFFKSEDKSIHIALAGPMTGPNQSVGKSFYQGVKLYLDEVNRQGGISGRKIELDVYDDHNTPELARDVAEQKIAPGQAVAVIGHHYSSCSIQAGEIYKTQGIAAISPASTNIKVTENNPWYFRTSFNDRAQGRFLAHYAQMVFGKSTASIIFENDDYGRYLADVFEQTSKELGTEIKYKWSFDANDRLLEDTLKQIVYDLKSKEKDAGVIFVSTHAGPGISILRTMKDALVINPLMGPDAFASEAFQKGFDAFPKEKRNPGYYTNGMYVTTPLIFDTSNEKGQDFKDRYWKKYGELPGWHAAFAYDSALVIVHALKNITLGNSSASLAEDRRKIRNFLAKMTSVDEAVEGVTGFNYFDQKGDAQKPVLIGVYKNRTIVSALTQFKAVTNPAVQAYLESSREKDRAIEFDGYYMYRINVIYTGVEMNEIRDMDFTDLSCTLDFFLWFRFQGAAELNQWMFLNAVEPLPGEKETQIGKEKKTSPGVNIELIREKVTPDNLHYYLYRVRGRFRMDFIPGQSAYGEHIVGISFRHPELDRNNLIYVKDVMGMGEINDERDILEKMHNAQVLSPAYNWKMSQVSFFQDTVEEISKGNPEYLNIIGSTVSYSRFNVGMRIVPDKLILRNMIPKKWVGYMFALSILFFLLIPMMGKTRKFGPFVKTLWFFHFITAFFLLMSGEYFAINRLGSTYYLDPVMLMLNILWWLIPAYFLSKGARKFIWDPLEEKTGRKVPHVVKNALSIIIYVLAVFGIVAFVFNHPLTSLLASTGVAAMILGLALQVNISNIFSGIAINVERPFRVGDWVKINEFKEGKVIDINWRTTRIKTRDDTILCISNSHASESVIENFSYPDDRFYQYFTVHIDPVHPPERVKKILLDAALSTEGVERDPLPSTRFLGLTAGMTGQSKSWAANYLVSVYVRDYGKKFAYNEAIWANIWTHLRQAGIRHVIDRQETHMVVEGVKRKKPVPDKALALLEEIWLFDPFPDDAKHWLSKRMKRHHFFPGESIVRQGDSGSSLFVIEEGVVAVRVKFDNQAKAVEVARMGAGNVFGEMGLLTGESRTATIISVTETWLYEVTKEDIAPLIERESRISRRMSDILTERKMATEAKKQTGDAKDFDKATIAAQIFNKIQNFFGFKK
ncbi:MAG: ABC transporter substrate-binding protein [Desulfococcaceae bacterium]